MSISATAIPAASRTTSAALHLTVMSGVAGFLSDLPAVLWDAPTDCAGWTVRDIAGHLAGAQEDLLSVRSTLRRRREGRRRYPRLSPLDAANQVQVDDFGGLPGADVAAGYATKAHQVAARVASFPSALAWIPVQPGMAPGGAPLRLGYLFNVIYVRDAWMHGIDLARATGRTRPATDADGQVLEQVMRDVAVEWASTHGYGRRHGNGGAERPEPGLTLELVGELQGTWHLGGVGPRTRVSGAGLEFVRGLSGRTAEPRLRCLDGDAAQVDRLAALRILF